MRGLINKALDFGGNASKCSSTMVLECGNTARLANYSYSIRLNNDIEVDNEYDAMQNFVDEFSKIETQTAAPKSIVIVSVYV